MKILEGDITINAAEMTRVIKDYEKPTNSFHVQKKRNKFLGKKSLQLSQGKAEIRNRLLSSDVHSSVSHKSKKVETIQLSINE